MLHSAPFCLSVIAFVIGYGKCGCHISGFLKLLLYISAHTAGHEALISQFKSME